MAKNGAYRAARNDNPCTGDMGGSTVFNKFKVSNLFFPIRDLGSE